MMQKGNTMSKEELITPVTPEEADDIRVTLDTEEGEIECRILTIFDVDKKDYIALMPLDEKGNDNADGEVYIYRYSEDKEEGQLQRAADGCILPSGSDRTQAGIRHHLRAGQKQYRS